MTTQRELLMQAALAIPGWRAFLDAKEAELRAMQAQAVGEMPPADEGADPLGWLKGEVAPLSETPAPPPVEPSEGNHPGNPLGAGGEEEAPALEEEVIVEEPPPSSSADSPPPPFFQVGREG